MLNKIFIDTRNYELEIKDDSTYLIESTNMLSTLKITVWEGITATLNFLVKESRLTFDLKLLNSSCLTINLLASDSSINISSKLFKDSNFNCTMNIISYSESINKIKIEHLGSNSKANFFANGINAYNEKFYFLIDGIIAKDSWTVSLNENSKIINLADGDSKIMPNLLVDNNEVSANHSAFIGKFPEEVIWYLNSRGLDTSKALDILIHALLLGGFTCSLEVKKKFEEFLQIILKNSIGGD